ncbi:regulator of G protein signaling superfamily [Basidiobolus meristosporus CBS 931.73]|uniref:Regulator of G protein signaling superfamily n=1 Tax=Basidiobolus meristosporus CBS 931.73 TaxID=1314790 RepID=A0A1Y1X5U2_9FUNG|nr:regulator of G protein signaling superfamily [Basidiobolus meristosporus CBS 931.73]|eukprot:ORX81180.1 regulator of G protein signaling superfamily [Basidiobolus meristosporus CBS 931.73]
MDNWTLSQKLYYSVAIGWNFILLSTTFLFVAQYQSPAIRYRSITLTVLMAIGNSLVTTLYLGREPTYNTFPCFLNIWVSSIGMPLWLTSVAGRFMRLAFLYHFSQAKLVAGSKGTQYINVSPEKSNLSPRQYAAFTAPTMVLDENWYYRHREKFTTKYIVRLILGALALQMGLSLLVQAFTTKFQITPTMAVGNCLVGWEFIPVFLTSAFYVFILCPLFITWLRGVNDAYGIKRELMADFTLGVVAFILYVVFAALPALKEVIKIFPAAHWSVVALMISHVFSVILPTIDALRGTDAASTKSTKMSSFESMVEDPQQFEVFKRFSQRDFSVENVLFFERIQKFRLHTSDIIDEGTLPTWVILEINSICSAFIAIDSEFELNLESGTAKEIRRRIQTNDVQLNIFDRAFDEIFSLMFRYTYPRFLKMEQQNLAEARL